ncbi:MAG: proteasome ATPase, partial [Actinobacteria bacterium]|nr:proteasome ATPase [Actinomycetota bacterium]
MSDDLSDLRKRVDDLSAHNELLTKTLREARDQVLELHHEIEKLGLPPNTFGLFISTAESGLINIVFNGRQMRVALSPEIDASALKRGQELILNESMNVIEVGGITNSGQLVTFVELAEDGERILVRGQADEVHVVLCAHPIDVAQLRSGDSLLCDLRAGFAFERIAKSEIDDLLLEEVPDVSYEDIGGLQEQIESIVDAVELPFLQAKMFADYSLMAPKGILLYGP